jgi:hypothetical protein
MRGWHRHMLAAGALLAALPALAQQAPVEDSLYQQALQSLAEGRKNDASDTFMRVIEKEPLHAGAWLEVALIQCSLGRADEAERLFAAIETRFNPSPAIAALIAEARETGCDSWQPLSSGSLSFARGIDQNVNQGAANPSYIVERDGGTIELPLLPEFLPRHDQYSVLTADYLREVTHNGSIAFAQFQLRRNDSLRQYDSTSLFTGIETPYRWGKWTLRTTAMVGLVSLGGHYYQRQLQLQARLGPPLPLPNSTQFQLMSSLTRTQYLTLSNFNSTSAELRGQLSYRRGELFASAALGVLADQASGARPGGDRGGWLASLVMRRKLGPQLAGELAYTRQAWTGTQAYLPGVIDTVRDQQTNMLRATLSYPLAKNHSLTLEARAVRNRESISFFQYNNRLLQLSWQWSGL